MSKNVSSRAMAGANDSAVVDSIHLLPGVDRQMTLFCQTKVPLGVDCAAQFLRGADQLEAAGHAFGVVAALLLILWITSCCPFSFGRAAPGPHGSRLCGRTSG